MSERQARKKTDISPILHPGTNHNRRFVADFEVLGDIIEELRKQKLRIVLTQGVYDLIHEGHAKYLEIAKSYGDILIVGIDSDQLTKIRKGENRPIVPQEERIEMLVHLRHVDLVVLREADRDTGDFIRFVRPDVLVTSLSTKDFTAETAKQYEEYCGKIVTLPPQGVATTSARVRRLTIEGAEKLASEINKLTSEFIEKIRQS